MQEIFKTLYHWSNLKDQQILNSWNSLNSWCRVTLFPAKSILSLWCDKSVCLLVLGSCSRLCCRLIYHVIEILYKRDFLKFLNCLNTWMVPVFPAKSMYWWQVLISWSRLFAVTVWVHSAEGTYIAFEDVDSVHLTNIIVTTWQRQQIGTPRNLYIHVNLC